MEKFYKFGRKSSYFLIELRGNYGVYFFLVCMFQVSHARGQGSHVMCHVSHIYYTPSGEWSRPGWVLAFLFTFARTYRVRKIQPIAAGYYNLLLHYELYSRSGKRKQFFTETCYQLLLGLHWAKIRYGPKEKVGLQVFVYFRFFMKPDLVHHSLF